MQIGHFSAKHQIWRLPMIPTHGRDAATLAFRHFSPSPTLTVDVINVLRYISYMIASFRSKETQKVFEREFSRKLPQAIQKTAMRKLWQLDAAVSINDLRIPPNNHLEALKGNRKGQHSIRINKQYRICFKWKQHNAHDVEIVDYHKE
jgi:proteic killer suppression protein